MNKTHNTLTITLHFAALVLLIILLIMPNQLNAISASSLLILPLELFVIGLLLLSLLLLPGRTAWMLRCMLATLLALGAIFKCTDVATYKVFARPFNPVFDGYLFINGMNLLQGALGKFSAVVIAVLLLLAVIAIVIAAFWVLGRVQSLLCMSVKHSAVLLATGLVLWLLLFLLGSARAALPFYQHLSTHTRDILATVMDIRAFKRQLENTNNQIHAHENVLSFLQGKDVLVIFVESYGRTVLDNPEYAPHIRPLLERTNKTFEAKGFMARSGFLTSPTVGGLSWLAHGTAMSGLWIDNQIRYNSLMISEQPTLNRLFNRAGWRTVAVMPAITMDWPEGNYYGYDHIYDAHNLGYQGKPFNWVTMPDQYTLAAFHARELTLTSRTPVMAEIALISSHAPWTPIPQLIDWDSVGDGSVFNAQATSGDSPDTVWKDNARIRLQFRLSIEYALQTIASYVATYGNENTVVLVLGDHQPAPIVTGDNAGLNRGARDVPVHLIARDPKVIDRVAQWQWTPGMLPVDHAPVWQMDELRNRFIEAFSPASD